MATSLGKEARIWENEGVSETDLPWEEWTNGETWLIQSYEEMGLSPRALRFKLRQRADVEYKALDLKVFGQAVVFRYGDLDIPDVVKQLIMGPRGLTNGNGGS